MRPQKRALVIEAGFIQARNLSSSNQYIQRSTDDAKQKVCKTVFYTLIFF